MVTFLHTKSKKVFALIDKEAKSLNHSYVGTAHIARSSRENEDVAARVLKSLDVDVEMSK